MPRRPRPVSRRAPPRAAPPVISGTSRDKRTKPLPPAQREDSDSESEATSSAAGSHEYLGDHFDAEDTDAEPDAPRVAQWVDEEDLDELREEESEESSEDDEDDRSRLEADLKSLSFGALRKAQKTLANTQADLSEGDSDDEEDVSAGSGVEEDDTVPIPRSDKGKEREEPLREKKAVPKRHNKHAPVEMSSKRPVSRSRFVAQEKTVPRDPRFLPITGEFDAKRFHSQYGFLSDIHREELTTLRDNLKRAKKLLANSPRDLRAEREAEVERLERAVKRAESMVNKDRREKVEIEALSKAAKEEREKRKQGKKAWYMKDADKKELLLRAKYETLAATGGRGAVRKAIEKKQKKVNQKEKKKRPFVAGQRGGSAAEPMRKRAHSGQGSAGGPRKRPRTS